MVLRVLESDGANTSFNGHSSKRKSVLILVCCHKARGDRDGICESTDCLKADSGVV